MTKTIDRLAWLVRRVRRMPPAEWAWRVHSVVRIAFRRAGYGTAQHIPPEATDATWGVPWCQCGPLSPAYDAAVVAEAQRLLEHGPKAFGQIVPTVSCVPDWYRDPVTGQALPRGFGLAIDFRHFGRGVEVKYAWEVARHQWWVVLAQGWAVSGDKRILDALAAVLDDWCMNCSYPNGIHWSSPIEHGVRLINWSLTWHLIGGAQSPIFEGEIGLLRRSAWLRQIYQHVRFVSDNLSRHTSSSNHLLGELAGIMVAVRTWDRWSDLRAIGNSARAELHREAFRQFAPDGVNLEQSLSYHKFSLQFLLAAGLVVRGTSDDFDPDWWTQITKGFIYLAAVIEPLGELPRIGDSDDADAWRLALHVPSGYHELLAYGAWISGRADLNAKCRALDSELPIAAAVLATPANECNTFRSECDALCALPSEFLDGGYVLMGARLHQPDEWRVMMDCGSLGYNRICAHGHADALAVLVSSAGEPLLVDPGTYCYNLAPHWRRHFRGTASHNTLLIDDLDQSDYGGSFLWLRDVNCTVVEHLRSRGEHIVLAWHDGYERLRDPVRHWRKVTVHGDGTVRVEDWLECRKSHQVKCTWQAAESAVVVPGLEPTNSWLVKGHRARLKLTMRTPKGWHSRVAIGETAPPAGWVSGAFYEKQPAPAIGAFGTLQPNERLITIIEPAMHRPIAPHGVM